MSVNANSTAVARNRVLLECPICFRNYADVDPTTLPCGHSCCLEDGKLLWNCYLCGVPSFPDKLTVSYAIRELVDYNKSLLAIINSKESENINSSTIDWITTNNLSVQ